MKHLPLLLFLFFSYPLPAQSIELEARYPVVTQGDEAFPLAWFGGLNTPQTQMVDLDGDGDQDFLFFDKAGQLFLAARNDAGGFTAAPELVRHFPVIREWMMLRDYNLDGIPDLFHYPEAVDGITVQRGERRADGLLQFSSVDFGDPLAQLYFPFEGTRTPIFVSSIDYPAIHDIDFDGDLDILTFSVAGGYVEYYKNQAVERGFGADTLVYSLSGDCWGGFFESGLTTALDLAPTADGCFRNLLPPGEGNTGRPRHSGSTLLAFDADGNGLTDLMLGDISFRQLVLALNNGSREDAWISEQDSAWRESGVETDIPTFPAAFHLDLDQDGDRDILGSPSVVLNGQDVDVMWFYRNEGSDAAPDFRFVTRTFLVDDMLDFGTAANVTVFDADGDGRPDLIIGNNDEYTGTNTLDSRLRLLRNVTPEGGEIAFELIDEDYLGLSAFATTAWAYAPTFGDLDDDGDEDVVLGVNNGKLVFGENTAGEGNPPTFAPLQFEWQGIDAGQFAKPFLSDLDRDGLLDLLVGGFDGRIRFYRNVGTAETPQFNDETSATGNVLQLGLINTNSPGISTGHPTPWVLQYEAQTVVFTGNRSGTLERYTFGTDSSYTDDFTLDTKAVDGLDVGTFSNPGFGDFDGDGLLEMVMGNERGGVSFYVTNLEVDQTVGLFSPPKPDFSFQVSPNPTQGVITLSGWPRGAVTELQLLDVTGRILQRKAINEARPQVQWTVADGLPAGIYLLKASGPGGVGTAKVILQ